MAGGQIDVVDVADLRELTRVRVLLLDQLQDHSAGELARDDRDGYAVATIVEELLRVAGDVDGRRNRAFAERGAQAVIEISEVFLFEERPIRQRNLAVPAGSSSVMTPPSPSGTLSTYTTRTTRSGLASTAAWAIAPPPECPTSATCRRLGRRSQ